MERKVLFNYFFSEIVSLRKTLAEAYLSLPHDLRAELPLTSCTDFLASFDRRLQVDLFLSMGQFEEYPRDNFELLSTCATLFDNVLSYALLRFNETNCLFTGKWTDFRFLSQDELRKKADALRELMDDEESVFFPTLAALPQTWKGKKIGLLIEDRLGCIADYFVSYSGLGDERINNIVVAAVTKRMVVPYKRAIE